MAAKKDKKAKVEIQEWMYDIVREPVVTEKSMMGGEHGHVTFRVPLSATKPRVKMAVEALFDVKVTNVNTLIQKGKMKRTKGVKGFRKDVKKAIVTLEEGQNIDVGAGI